MAKKFKRKNPIFIPRSPLHPFIKNRTLANYEQEKLKEDIEMRRAGKNKL